MTWQEVIKNSYQIAVAGWGIQPSEFWNMDAQEWWWLYECKRPRDKERDYAGTLTEDVCAELYEMVH